MGLHAVDWMIVLVPLGLVLLIAVRTQRYVRGVSDFLAAGRCAGRYLVCNAAGEAGMGAITVVAASHNDVVTTVYADLGEVLRDWLRGDVGKELTPETYMDHARLVDAIRAGDAETAAAEAAGYPFHCRPGRVSPPPAGG